MELLRGFVAGSLPWFQAASHSLKIDTGKNILFPPLPPPALSLIGISFFVCVFLFRIHWLAGQANVSDAAFERGELAVVLAMAAITRQGRHRLRLPLVLGSGGSVQLYSSL